MTHPEQQHPEPSVWNGPHNPTGPRPPVPPSRPKRTRAVLSHVGVGVACLIIGAAVGGVGDEGGEAVAGEPTAGAEPERVVTEEADGAEEPTPDAAPTDASEPAVETETEAEAETEPEAAEGEGEDGPEEDAGGPVTSFRDGTYLVGVDIAAGEYFTEGPGDEVFSVCYWSRNTDSSGEFDAIIANGLPEGPSRVTVNEGEYFETTGCSWELR